MEDWRKRPTIIHEWNEEFDCVMAIDENGTTDLKGIRKKIRQDFFSAIGNKDKIALPHDRWFTISGVVMEKDAFATFRDAINSIKYGHWEEGKFDYKQGNKRVVFHSSEIRKRVGPFNPKFINYGDLMTDISGLVENSNFLIYSSSIDKISHVLSYANPYPVYNLCLDFIVERFCRSLNLSGKKGILLLESRGKKEDKHILKHLINLLEKGNHFHLPGHFNCIKGVYFNPKWSSVQKDQASFVLLELADLISYPIFKFVSTGNQDAAFNILKNKLYNYPNYDGFGLKRFPK